MEFLFLRYIVGSFASICIQFKDFVLSSFLKCYFESDMIQTFKTIENNIVCKMLLPPIFHSFLFHTVDNQSNFFISLLCFLCKISKYLDVFLYLFLSYMEGAYYIQGMSRKSLAIVNIIRTAFMTSM